MTSTSSQRVWLIGGALAGLLMVVVGYFFVIAPKRSETSSVNGQLASVRMSNTTLESKIALLAAQNKNLAKYEAALATEQKALPATPDLSSLLKSIQDLGAQTLVDVSEAGTFGGPAAVQTVNVNGTSSVTGTTDGTTNGTTTNGTTGTSTTDIAAENNAAISGTTDPAATTTTPSAAGGVLALPITLQVTGSVPQLEQFLTALQNAQPRAVLITSISETSAPSSGKSGSDLTSLQLNMQAFVDPSTAVTSTTDPTSTGG